jgi:hypothetical protein
VIYVDNLIEWGRPGGYPNAQAERVGARNGHRWCHMVSDLGPDVPELHAMAVRLGLRRSWFQGDHYDLVPGRRSAALALGALEADRAKIVAIFRANRVHRARCKGCGHVETFREAPPPTCPACGRSATPILPPL